MINHTSLTKYIFSWGGGVNSTAIFAMIKLGMLPELTPENTHIVFADTGAEMPHTYDHTTTCRFLDKFEWVLLNPSDDRYRNLYSKVIQLNNIKTLEEYYYHYHIIPCRLNRSCTQHFKIDPIRKYKERVGASVMIIGIDAGEQHRAKELGSDRVMYPLIDKGLDRKGCISLIKEADLPIPKKSGCYFCPFQRKEGWLELYLKFPQLFKKVEELESQRRRLDLYIKDEPIRQVVEKWVKKEKAKCDQPDMFDTMRHCLCEL